MAQKNRTSQCNVLHAAAGLTTILMRIIAVYLLCCHLLVGKPYHADNIVASVDVAVQWCGFVAVVPSTNSKTARFTLLTL